MPGNAYALSKQLTEIMLQENAANTRQVCRLWQRILASLPLDAESSQAMQWLNARTGCLF